MQSKYEGDQHQSTTTLDDLPDEVLELIFNKCSVKDQLFCGCICKKWLKVTSENPDFMRKVQLKIEYTWITTELIRKYKLISIINIDFNYYEDSIEPKFHYLANCKELEIVECRFKNMAQLAKMISGCKSLLILKLIKVKAKADDLEGLTEAEACESCVNINAIYLQLDTHIRDWEVLKVFKIIKFDISQLRITVFYSDFADMTNMMNYVHQNHRNAFKGLNLSSYGYKEPTLSPLFISQIKQLLSLSIGVDSEKILDQISKNMIELQCLNLKLICARAGMMLNNLKNLSELKRLSICVSSHGESLSLYIKELQQLKMLHVYALTDAMCTLNFPDLSPQQQITSISHLRLSNFIITRNMLQLIFKTMPNLRNLHITNQSNDSSQKKRLSRNNNAISQLKRLQILEIDNFWIDENFLRNMKLPLLEKFTLFSNENHRTVSFSELSNIGLLYLAKHCPKLMEITANAYYKNVVIASRKTAGCPFNNQDVSAETICEPIKLSEIILDEEDFIDYVDGENGDYSEEEIFYIKHNSFDDYDEHVSDEFGIDSD